MDFLKFMVAARQIIVKYYGNSHVFFEDTDMHFFLPVFPSTEKYLSLLSCASLLSCRLGTQSHNVFGLRIS